MALNSKTVLKLFKNRKVFSESVSDNKSDVWKHFSNLHFSTDYFDGFVLCSFCKNALKYNGTSSGTTHLRDYMTHCLENPSNQHSHHTTSRFITIFETPQQLSQPDQNK